MPQDAMSPRAWLAKYIENRAADSMDADVALSKLAELRDPPADPPGAAWTAPDEKAVKRHG